MPYVKGYYKRPKPKNPELVRSRYQIRSQYIGSDGQVYVVDPLMYLYNNYNIPFSISKNLKLQKFIDPVKGGYSKAGLDEKAKEFQGIEEEE